MAKKDTSPLAMGRQQKGSTVNKKKKKDEEKKAVVQKRPQSSSVSKMTQQQRQNQKSYGTTQPKLRQKSTSTTSKSYQQRQYRAETNNYLKQNQAHNSRTRVANTAKEMLAERENATQQRSVDPKEARRQESARNMRTAATRFASEDRRTAAQAQKMNMPTAEEQRRSRENIRAAGKAIGESVRETLSSDNAARMQRQKSGIQTEEDKRYYEQRNQRRIEVAKNTGRAAKKGVQDTLTGYGKTLADVDEMAKSSDKWTEAKSMKLGIDKDDTAGRAKVEEERQKSIKEARRLRLALDEKQEKRQKEFDEATKNAKGLEKAWYGAVESGTGMATDMAVGAVTGTGQVGALASMGIRSYGATRGQAEKEGATENEDRLYSLLSAGKEVGTEMMFQGAGLAKSAFSGGKVGLSLADKAANALTKGITGKKADIVGAGVRLLGGTAEENAEEAAGWIADPLIKELTYGRNVRERMKESLLSNIPQVNSREEADRVASYFSTSKFTDDLVKDYTESGMSKEQATELAEEIRDMYAAYYAGDQETLDSLSEDLAGKLSGQAGLSRQAWSLGELADTFASTTLLTLTTGIPAAASTSIKGNQIFDSPEIKEQFGENAAKKVADIVKSSSDAKLSVKADAMAQRLESGKDITGTQKYDLIQGLEQRVKESAKRAQASEGAIREEAEAQDLVPTYGLDRNGNRVFAPETEKAFNAKYAQTELTVEAVKNYMESDSSISDDEARRSDAVKKAISDLHVGALTVGDVLEFGYGNELAREALKAEEGIDLNDYIVRNSDGSIDYAATSEATEDALFKINAQNAIEAARVETEVYIDRAKGNIDRDIMSRMSSNGQSVWKNINQDLDPRNISEYLTKADSVEFFYQAGRNTDVDMNTFVAETANSGVYKNIDTNILKRAFAAGARDRIILNTPGYGQTVKAGSNIALKNTTPILTGQLFVDPDVELTDTQQAAYLALAMSTNTNIHIKATLKSKAGAEVNGQSQGNDIYLNVNAGAEKNLGYVFMHEMTHQIKQYAPNEYMALENLVREKWFNKDAKGMKRHLKSIIDLYSVKGGQTLSEEDAMEEIIADAMAEAIDDPNFAAEVCEQDLALGQAILNSIKEALRSIRAMFTGDNMRNEAFHKGLLSYLGILDEAEKMWINALATARKNKAAGLIADWQDRANKTNAEGKHSINATAGNEIRSWYDSTTEEQRREEGGFIQIGTTPSVYFPMGIRETKLQIGKNKIQKLLDDHPEMNIDKIIAVINGLENPMIVLQSITQKNSIVVYGEVYTDDGKPIMAAVKFNRISAEVEDLKYGVVTSAYARSAKLDEGDVSQDQHQINNGRILYINPNKEKTDSWLNILRLQLPSDITSYGYISKLAYYEDLVNNTVSGETPMQRAIREAQERKAREEAKNSISDSDMVIQDGNARWTNERIDSLISEYGASDERYSKAYAVMMNPRDFLKLTLPDERLEQWNEGANQEEHQEVFSLDEERLQRERQTPFLIINSSDSASGVVHSINGHEGRHRMRALMEAGIESVPVALIDYDTKYSKEHTDWYILVSQDFGDGHINNKADVEVQDLVPIKESNRDELIQKFGGEAQVRFSITPEQDAEYIKAVESGDMETAQRMVDEAAAKAGYNIKVYHGTANGGRFNIFDPKKLNNSKLSSYIGQGFYFTNSREGAEEYTVNSDIYGNRTKGKDPYLYEGYLKLQNPIEITDNSHNLSLQQIRNIVADGNKEWFFDRGIAQQLQNKDIDGNKYTKDELLKMDRDQKIDLYAQYLSESGDREALSNLVDAYAYDQQEALLVAMQEHTGHDGIHWNMKEGLDQFVVFESSQFKESAPATYDDNGNVIPLSERFNTGNEDIRYSIGFNDKSFDELNDAEQGVIHEAVSPDIRFSMPTERDVLPKARYKSDIGFSNAISAISGKQARINALVKNGFSEKQAKQTGEAISNVILDTGNWIEGDLQSEFTFIGWDDLINAEVSVRKDWKGKVVGVSVSAMVANGEYPVNFDLTTICNKREGIMQVIQNLTRIKTDTGKSVLDSVKLTDQDMWNINKALKAEGIDTACLGCFVEARRYYTNRFIASIDNKWNTAVRETRRQLGLPEEEYFNFAHGKKVTGEDYTAISDLWTSYEKSKDTKKSPEQRIRILMNEIIKNNEVDSPYLKLVSASDILTPEGISGLKQISTGKHDLVKTLKSIYGTSAPKEILAFTPYNSEIALLPKNLKGQRADKYLRSIGGIRIQSFSDFKIEHVIDHMQMVADMAARKFTCHAYSKVIAFPRIFGLTGQKINMSVMFDITPAEEWQTLLGCSEEKAKEYAFKYAGLRFVTEKPAENPDNRPYIEADLEGVHGYLTYLLGDADYINSVYEEEYQKNIAAGMDENEARRKANEAKPFEQSINYREAVELENQEGYKENVGIIAVAYGDEHLKILLADPNVRYVIPYHKSGLPVFVSEKTSLQYARNYEPVQNTKKADPKEKLQERFSAFKEKYKGEYPAIAFFGDIYENGGSIATTEATATEAAKLHGTGEFDVYKDLDKAKDIKEVANAYLEDCIENNLVPVFSEFAGDPNYYKMLFDFAVTDGTTDHIYPQKTVRNNYPGIDVDAKIAAGEEIAEDDYVKLREAIRKGASEENAKNQTRSENMKNVLDDILSKDSENSILAGTNVNAIRDSATDYTDPKGIKYSITPEMDEEYMDAYFDGDDDAMQELVDEAAERAGYTYKAYHHTEHAFTVFDLSKARRSMDIQGFYFSSDPEAEREYGSVRYDVYLKIENPYIVDSSDAMKALPFDFGTEDAGVRARDWLKENGYDAVIRDASFYGAEADEIIVLDPEQIKSSEPMLFEDDPNGEYGEGEVIPLSQRFDPTNPDIRYSLPTQDADGKVLTDGQMEYFKNSMARDEQGRLIPVYHATPIGGFTVFDPSRSSDGRSISFTNDFDFALNYAAEYDDIESQVIASDTRLGDGETEGLGHYQVYLNLENPYIVDGSEIVFNDEVAELTAFAQSEGYDGLIMRNFQDMGADIYQVFSSNQIKDIRNENPTENPDIRYSITPEDEGMDRMAQEYAQDDSWEALAAYEAMIADEEFQTDFINSSDEAYARMMDKEFSKRFKRAAKRAKQKGETVISVDPDSLTTNDIDKFFDGLTRYADGMKFDDPVLDEGRVRMAKSKREFFDSHKTRWNQMWSTEGRVLDIKSVKDSVRELVTATMYDSNTDRKYRTDTVNKTILDLRTAFYYEQQGRTDIVDELLWHSALRMIDGVEFYVDDANYETYKNLRDFLKTAKVQLGEEYWSDVDFGAFRKANFGRINLVRGETNVDKILGELYYEEDGETKGIAPEWFSPEAFEKNNYKFDSVPDILLQMDAVLDAMQPYAEAYSSEYCAEWATDIASDLLEIMHQEGERIVSKADRYEDRIKAMKQRHAEAMLKVRQQRDEGIKREKAKFKEYKEQRKERQAHKLYFDRIVKTHKALVDRLVSNTADKNIPEQYKRELANLLAAFDLQTVGSKAREEKTGHKAKKTIKLGAIRDTLRKIEDRTQLFRLSDAITDIMDGLSGIEGKTIDELSAAELSDIDKMLRSLLHEFNTYRNVRAKEKKMKAADIGAAQVESDLAHAKKYGRGNDYQGFLGALDKLVNMDEMTPAYLFKRIDPNKQGLGLMYGEIRKSLDTYIRNQNQLNGWMEEIVGKYHQKGVLWNKYGSGELANWRSTNYKQTFNLSNGTVELTPAQMMSLYCLSRRNQAYRHMIGAGIVVAPVSFQAKIMSDIKERANMSLPVILTDADIQTICAALTPEQVNVANQLQELMSTKMADWGNDASMRVLGIKLFNETDYFPIKSDKAALQKDLNDQEFVEAIRNFGFTKAVQPGARNAIMVEDIFDVVAEHCNNMNLYNAYSESINDFMKVYNYRHFMEDGSEYTVQQSVAHAYSRKATTFIMSFMRDLNGNVSGRDSGIESMMQTALGNAKKASVFANGRVALQQPTAITRAFAVIDPKYLKGVKPEKGAMQEMFEHCPIALWKSWGYYDINMGRSIEDIMMNNGSWAEDKMTDLYGKLDNVTWTAIWQMVKAEMKDTHPDVKIGSDEYFELCNERMTEIVDLTQVVDSPLHRSHGMRDKSFFMKMSTSFMAEPTLTFNMIKDGYVRSYEAFKAGDKAQAAKIFGRTSSVALIQAAAVASCAAIWDALRGKNPGDDDDDEELSKFRLWWLNTIENFKDETLKPWNKIYIVKDIASIFEGWDNKNLAFQGYQTLYQGLSQMQKKLTKGSKTSWWTINSNIIGGFGYLIGVPFKTVMKDSMSIYKMLGFKSDFVEKMLSEEKTEAVLEIGDGIKPEGLTGKLADFFKEDEEPDAATKSVEYSDEYLPDNLTEEQKEEIRKAGERRAKRGVKTSEAADRDKNTMLYEAEKAAAGYEGSERDKKIWSSVSQGYKSHIESGDFAYIARMRDVVKQAGGDLDYFDEQINKATKSALKKTIEPGGADTEAEMVAQQNMRYYLQAHGVTQEEISSDICYKSDAAKDLKVAFRLGDEQAIIESTYALMWAGITQTDIERLYKNRNRMDLTKYDGKYKDRLKSTGNFIWPTEGVITSHFGYRNAPTAGASSNHPAIDIGAPQGTAVVAADGGTVIYAGRNSGYGNSVGIKHDNGMVTYYNHLYSWNVNVGDTVGQGQQIAQVGSTGISTGPHLDFKILDANGEPVDPEMYLQKRQ